MTAKSTAINGFSNIFIFEREDCPSLRDSKAAVDVWVVAYQWFLAQLRAAKWEDGFSFFLATHHNLEGLCLQRDVFGEFL